MKIPRSTGSETSVALAEGGCGCNLCSRIVPAGEGLVIELWSGGIAEVCADCIAEIQDFWNRARPG